jgi:hypothetical protein
MRPNAIMRPKTLLRTALAALMLVAVFLLPAAAASASGGAAMYEVTIENLTAQQILSPPVFISHDAGYRLFRFNHFARTELRLIAEDGNNGPAATRATYSRRVFDVQTASGGILPGTSATVTLRAPRGARLSLATMLVQTNDGFAGVNSLRLRGLDVRTVDLMALDAGTEANNEMAAYVPGPPFGGMMRDPTHKRIAYHRGIQGGADIDASVYGWSGPVARLTITPVTP